MAVINRGILGGGSGRVANVVMSSWKGRATLRALPLSVANPRTTPQVNQRTKFSAIAILGSEILSNWIKPLWDRFAGNISGYNAFVKDNAELVSNLGVPDWGNLIYAKGRMTPPQTFTIVADVSAGTVAGNVTFPNDLTWGQSGESVYVMAIDSTINSVQGVEVVTGSPGDVVAYSIARKDFSAGDTIYVFFVVKRADGTQVSDASGGNVVAVA